MLTCERALVRGLVAALGVVAVLLPAVAGVARAADPDERLDAVESQLEGAERDLHDVDRRHREESADLEAVEARMSALQSELAALDGELDGAQAALDDKQRALAITTSELVATEDRLAGTRRRLRAQRVVFVERARATYMYGGAAAYSGYMAGVDSLQEFHRGMKYARVVLSSEQREVELMTGLERTVQRETVELGKLQERREAQRSVAAEERDRVAGIVAARQSVADEVAAQADRQRGLLAELEADRRSYVAMVTDLRAEGEKLQAELRARAEAEAARRAAAERAQRRAAAQQAVQEARRVAAADQARATRSRLAARAPAPAPAPAPAAPVVSSAGFRWPADGPMTSAFGWRTHPIFGTARLHTGVDIGAGYGAPVYAATDGVVVSAGGRGGYGNAVVIDHGGGIATLYAHQSQLAVGSGESVGRGEVIGYVGSTGYVTGPHLHFEVLVNGTPVDPMGYF